MWGFFISRFKTARDFKPITVSVSDFFKIHMVHIYETNGRNTIIQIMQF